MGKILDAFADDELCVNPTTYNRNREYRKAVDTMYKTAEELAAKLNDEEKKRGAQFFGQKLKAPPVYRAEY